MNFRRAGVLMAIALGIVLFFLNRKDVTLVKQDSFELHAISATGDQYSSIIHLKNPNLLSSTIKTIHEKYSINGVTIAVFTMEINQGIPGLKETEFPINVRFSKEDYANAVHTDSIILSDIQVLIDGEITFENLASKGEIKIHQTETIGVRDL